MFKELLQRIIESENRQDALINVFYGTVWDENDKIIRYGVNSAFQHGKITAKEHTMLLEIINKMA